MIRKILEAIDEKELHPSAGLTGGSKWRGVDPGIKKAVEELVASEWVTIPGGVPSESMPVFVHVASEDLFDSSEQVDMINDVDEWMMKPGEDMPVGITGAAMKGGQFDPILTMYPGYDQADDMQAFWSDVISAANKVKKVVSWYDSTGTQTAGEVAGPYTVFYHGANFDDHGQFSTYEQARAAGKQWVADAKANNPDISDDEVESEFGWSIEDKDGNEVDSA